MPLRFTCSIPAPSDLSQTSYATCKGTSAAQLRLSIALRALHIQGSSSAACSAYTQEWLALAIYSDQALGYESVDRLLTQSIIPPSSR